MAPGGRTGCPSLEPGLTTHTVLHDSYRSESLDNWIATTVGRVGSIHPSSTSTALKTDESKSNLLDLHKSRSYGHFVNGESIVLNKFV